MANLDPDPKLDPDPQPGFGVKQQSQYEPAPPNPKKQTIAWAVTVSKDGNFVDGAAVLMRGVQLATKDSVYNHAFVAIVHPTIKRSRVALARLGWVILEAPTPVNVTNIQGDFLRSHIVGSGYVCNTWTNQSPHRIA